jgi:hypothetical protein
MLGGVTQVETTSGPGAARTALQHKGRSLQLQVKPRNLFTAEQDPKSQENFNGSS